MKRSGLVLFVALLFGNAHAEDTVQNVWRLYRSTDAGYAVEFPGEPRMETKALQDGSTYRSAVVDRNDTAFLVIAIDYPAGMFTGKDQQLMLDEVRDRLLSAAPTAARGERRFVFAGHAARELIIDDAHGSTQIYRLYVMGDRLYQVVCGGPHGFDTEREVARFEDSFKLVGQ